jgi:hypothetical protein
LDAPALMKSSHWIPFSTILKSMVTWSGDSVGFENPNHTAKIEMLKIIINIFLMNLPHMYYKANRMEYQDDRESLSNATFRIGGSILLMARFNPYKKFRPFFGRMPNTGGAPMLE